MNSKSNIILSLLMITFLLVAGCAQDKVYTQTNESQSVQTDESKIASDLDQKVDDFLNNRSRSWRDSNVPYSDGKLLHDIIVENNYKYAVEIGTSTGHSAIWIAWALSKTGGKLITIEIDRGRHNQAKANFEEAGVSEYIDARLADAHELVPKLEGPVDFVFCDADKEWYINYFKALAPKMVVGGCFTAHNTNQRGVREYISYVSNLPGFETTIDNRGSGMGITYKTGD